MERRNGDTLQSRRYSIWERLSDIFQVEPQSPGPGGIFRLSSIVHPTVDAIRQLWDNGLYYESISYTLGFGGILNSVAVPAEETWLVFNITWSRSTGDNTVDDMRIRGLADDGTAIASFLDQTAGEVNKFVSFGGGILTPGGTVFQAGMSGAGGSSGFYNLVVWHQKIPESGLLPAPPYN